jgi:hypothetical protein
MNDNTPLPNHVPIPRIDAEMVVLLRNGMLKPELRAACERQGVDLNLALDIAIAAANNALTSVEVTTAVLPDGATRGLGVILAMQLLGVMADGARHAVQSLHEELRTNG